jgi:hypothetical protein
MRHQQARVNLQATARIVASSLVRRLVPTLETIKWDVKEQGIKISAVFTVQFAALRESQVAGSCWLAEGVHAPHQLRSTK